MGPLSAHLSKSRMSRNRVPLGLSTQMSHEPLHEIPGYVQSVDAPRFVASNEMFSSSPGWIVVVDAFKLAATKCRDVWGGEKTVHPARSATIHSDRTRI